MREGKQMILGFFLGFMCGAAAMCIVSVGGDEK
jgi:hypothetical protein